jgi:hypothetical protein
MSYGEQGRAQTARWEDLDALVLEEMEALGGRSRERRSAPQPLATAKDAGLQAPRSYREPPDDAETDEADEDSFIERTVDYLRDRPDADALLEAVRATLYDQDPGPLDIDKPDPAEGETGAAAEVTASTEPGDGP